MRTAATSTDARTNPPAQPRTEDKEKKATITKEHMEKAQELLYALFDNKVLRKFLSISRGLLSLAAMDFKTEQHNRNDRTYELLIDHITSVAVKEILPYLEEYNEFFSHNELPEPLYAQFNAAFRETIEQTIRAPGFLFDLTYPSELYVRETIDFCAGMMVGVDADEILNTAGKVLLIPSQEISTQLTTQKSHWVTYTKSYRTKYKLPSLYTSGNDRDRIQVAQVLSLFLFCDLIDGGTRALLFGILCLFILVKTMVKFLPKEYQALVRPQEKVGTFLKTLDNVVFIQKITPTVSVRSYPMDTVAAGLFTPSAASPAGQSTSGLQPLQIQYGGSSEESDILDGPPDVKHKIKTRPSYAMLGRFLDSTAPTAPAVIDLTPWLGFTAVHYPEDLNDAKDAKERKQKSTLFPVEGLNLKTGKFFSCIFLDEEPLMIDNFRAALPKARSIKRDGVQGIRLLTNVFLLDKQNNYKRIGIYELKLLGEFGDHRLIGFRKTIKTSTGLYHVIQFLEYLPASHTSAHLKSAIERLQTKLDWGVAAAPSLSALSNS